jgi:hypothetical protein
MVALEILGPAGGLVLNHPGRDGLGNPVAHHLGHREGRGFPGVPPVLASVAHQTATSSKAVGLGRRWLASRLAWVD